MPPAKNFTIRLEEKIAEQLRSDRISYLLGAGSSYLDKEGYPLAFELWDLIKDKIPETSIRADIQAKIDGGASGIEQALDLLDDGGAKDALHRHWVTLALAELMMPKAPPLALHKEFVQRLAQRANPSVKVFSLNYDPLIERAAVLAQVRVIDGYWGADLAFFDAAVFEERIGRIRGNYRGRQFEETVKPIHLLKLHGSLGWYECQTNGIRRCGFSIAPPAATKRLMVPPQSRKVIDTLYPPYTALWSAFRGCLVHNAAPINRLVCIGYGLADEHVNAVIEAALGRTDFTVLIFAKELNDTAWERWSPKANTIIVTKSRCSIKGEMGPGHIDLWSFERLAKGV